MKPLLLLVLVSALLDCPTWEAVEVPLHGNSVVRFADVDEGSAALGERDLFIRSLSPFDRQVRLKSDKEVSEREFLAFVGEQVLAWESNQVEKLSQLVALVGRKLAPFQLDLPPTVLLVQTTGREESGAAYCRGAAVVVPQNMVRRSEKSLEKLLTHELFHVLSSHNPELQDRLYALVGFEPCGEIQLPASLQARKITNPDAPVCEHYMEVQRGGLPVKVVPILFSSSDPYDSARGGSLFQYLTFRLMVVDQRGDRWSPVEENGEPILLEPREVPTFFEKIGRNTSYIIHPEEILAENFVLLVNNETEVPTPRILKEMRDVLSPR
jgi:hypothetical protein